MTFKRRLSYHLHSGSAPYFSNALRKHGIDKFDFQIIPCPVADLDKMECALISELNSRVPNGFNIAVGGKGNRGWVPSEETRKRMSRAQSGKVTSEACKRKLAVHMIGNKYASGHKLTEENKAKLLAANLGHKASDETRRKMSLSRTGKKGHAMTAEHKAKLLASNLGRMASMETRMKMSVARIGNRNAAGHPLSLAHKEKLRNGARAYWAKRRATD
jgi:group I intron endonuclease